MRAERVLSLDCGTQSLRALVFDASGTLVARRKVEYQPYFSLNPGWAEQDPEIWWNALVEAVRGLGRDDPAALEGISGIAVTAQRDSLICLDADARPVRPASSRRYTVKPTAGRARPKARPTSS